MIKKDKKKVVSWCHDCNKFYKNGMPQFNHTLKTNHTISIYSKNAGFPYSNFPWPGGRNRN